MRSSVSIVIKLDDRGSVPGRGNDGIIFLIVTASRPNLGSIQPPIQWMQQALSPEVKRPGRKADHSPPLSAESKNAWIYATTPPIRLHGVVLS
jgi:hypothetical protein